jgi:hypothetical protein
VEKSWKNENSTITETAHSMQNARPLLIGSRRMCHNRSHGRGHNDHGKASHGIRNRYHHHGRTPANRSSVFAFSGASNGPNTPGTPITFDAGTAHVA